MAAAIFVCENRLRMSLSINYPSISKSWGGRVVSSICQNCGRDEISYRRTYKGIGVIYVCLACNRKRTREIENNYKKRRAKMLKGFKQARRMIFENRLNACEDCGSIEGLHVHHIQPLSKGGGNEMDNLKLLCTSCHYQAHRSPP